MRYLALATDYDGTVATHGSLQPETIAALERLRASGRKLILVTGRELPDLKSVCARIDLFDLVVAENGALLFDPHTGSETQLAPPPPLAFGEALKAAGVRPLSIANVMVSTLEDQKERVLDTIQRLGLELQMIFNKGSVMILPSGVNKATGLLRALRHLRLSPRNLVGVGDAENDHAFLAVCERAVSVQGALPSLKDRSDLVTSRDAGAGVAELIRHLLENDLGDVPARDDRDTLLLGTTEEGDFRIPFYDASILIAGASGGGKSTLSTGIVERLMQAGYQVCVLDPEGDYQEFEDVAVVGDSKRPPAVQEAVSAIEEESAKSLVLNLLGVAAPERPAFFTSLIPQLCGVRKKTGRPHWIVVDEAHHFAPETHDSDESQAKEEMRGMMLITLQPDHVRANVVGALDAIVAVGEKPRETVAKFCQARRDACPSFEGGDLERGKALYWSRNTSQPATIFTVAPAVTSQVRHRRKYSTADLTPDRSFYFRGPEGKLNLRAQNLMTFVQLLQGVDDETWLYHVKRGEYSQWFRDNIKNDELADAAARFEEQDLSAKDSKDGIRQAIEERFTLPA